MWVPRTPLQGLCRCVSFGLQFVILLALPPPRMLHQVLLHPPAPTLISSSSSSSARYSASTSTSHARPGTSSNVASSSDVRGHGDVVYYEDLYH
ncbi:hypothetical protein F5880DRAFT_1598840 [Lentinula raphanica]|nr:hypothetical protein F5880DRAFT_1598840 [Lentinula raphanica]